MTDIDSTIGSISGLVADIEADLHTQEEALGTLASDAPGFDLGDF